MNLGDIKVEEFTSPILITMGPEEGISKAMELMREHAIRHLPLVQNGEVMGVVSERDLLTHYGKNWDKFLKLEDIMRTDLLVVHQNDSLGDVAFALSSEKKGSAIVLDERDELYGIFTTTDALNALVEIIYSSENKWTSSAPVSL